MENKLNFDCWYHDVCQLENDCNVCIRYSEMKYLMDNSGLPISKQRPIILKVDDCDYDAFVRLSQIKDNIVDFVERGNNLLICGCTGNGKTSWAIKLLLKYFDEIWAGNGFRVRGVFVHVPTLLLQLKNFDYPLSQEYKESLMKADIVIWDEIGGVGMSNYDYSQLLMYIDSRMINDKTNIFTSNLITKEQFSDKLGERLTSRVYSSLKIELKGKDRRNDTIASY